MTTASPLQLTFDAVQQVLTMIEFYEVNRVALKFGRVVIFGGDISATFMSIYNVGDAPCVEWCRRWLICCIP